MDVFFWFGMNFGWGGSLQNIPADDGSTTPAAKKSVKNMCKVSDGYLTPRKIHLKYVDVFNFHLRILELVIGGIEYERFPAQRKNT